MSVETLVLDVPVRRVLEWIEKRFYFYGDWSEDTRCPHRL